MKTVHRLVPMAAIGGALLLLATAVAAADGVLHPFWWRSRSRRRRK